MFITAIISIASLCSAAVVRSSGSVVGRCEGYDFPAIVCLRRYASVLQPGFERTPRDVLGNADTYGETETPGDQSFQYVSGADFLVWDSERAAEILGDQPSSEFMFTLPHHSHNAPVYIPETNELMFSRLEQYFLPQIYINLTADPPTLREKTANPPVYGPTGARYKDGLIYVSTLGGGDDIQGISHRPGIYTIDPVTLESKALLNNYFGWFFNAADDLDIDQDGTIWFTDNYYGRPTHLNDRAPMIRQASYRFNIGTGLVVVAEDTLIEPNGIQLSLDGRKLFLTDTGAGVANIDPHIPAAKVPSIIYNSTGKRTIYSFDVETTVDARGSVSKRLINKVPIHYSMDYAPDGLKISREGYLVTGAGHGVTVLTQSGDPVLRVQTNFTVVHIGWAGIEMDELWAVGIGGAQRIRLGIKGPF